MKRVYAIAAAASLFTMPLIAGAEEPQRNPCQELANILQAKVTDEDGICSMSVVRQTPPIVHMGKAEQPDMIGFALHANFKTENGQAKVLGEFALLENEVNDVIDVLRRGNMKITAVHNHWLEENPRILYLHFQGTGIGKQLAKTVKEAMDKTISEMSKPNETEG